MKEFFLLLTNRAFATLFAENNYAMISSVCFYFAYGCFLVIFDHFRFIIGQFWFLSVCFWQLLFFPSHFQLIKNVLLANGLCLCCTSRTCSKYRFREVLVKYGLKSVGSCPTNFEVGQRPEICSLWAN